MGGVRGLQQKWWNLFLVQILFWGGLIGFVFQRSQGDKNVCTTGQGMLGLQGLENVVRI